MSEVFQYRDPEPVQLQGIHGAEGAVQRHPDQEHINKVFMFREPESEQLNERSESRKFGTVTAEWRII